MSNVEERYARATGSSHLEVKRHEEAPGDADTIIAAGMSEPLGTLLARLKAEWDSISRREAQQAGNSLTARLLILMQLRSLEPARLALVAYAISHARDKALPDRSATPRAELRALTQKLGQDLTPDDRAATVAAHLAKVREVSDAAAAHHQRVVNLVGKVLEAWLDKICEPCAGRGFSGGVGAPVVLCSACKGSKVRRTGQLSDVAGEHQYGLWLLNVIEIKIAGSMGQMAKKTRRA